MFKHISKTIKSFFISVQQARTAAILARNGKHAEAQALFKE